MKTQLIKLDQYDDIVSARDKLLWCKAPRIIFVFPQQQQTKFSLIDLLVLFRQAQKQGSQAAIVVKNKEIRNHLDRLGIPGFTSTQAANRERWVSTRRIRNFRDGRVQHEDIWDQGKIQKKSTNPQLSISVRYLIFLFAITAVLCLLAVFIPKTTIRINAEAQIQEYTFELLGDPEVSEGQLNGIIPVHTKTVMVEGRVETETTGTVLLPDGFARGVVQLTNLTEEPIRVPEGTIFSSLGEDPVRFASWESALLPGGIGETTHVDVSAVLPGIQGNLEEGALQVVEGELGLDIDISGSEQMVGGTQIRLAAPSEADRLSALSLLYLQLDETASSEMENVLLEEEMIIPETISLVSVAQEDTYPEIGFPGDSLDLWMQAEYQAWIVDEADIRRIASSLLDATLPEGFRAKNQEIELHYLSSSQIRDQQLHLSIISSRVIEREVDSEWLVKMLAGNKPEQGAALLADGMGLQKAPTIQVTPEWWPILPFLRYQYEVLIIP